MLLRVKEVDFVILFKGSKVDVLAGSCRVAGIKLGLTRLFLLALFFILISVGAIVLHQTLKQLYIDGSTYPRYEIGRSSKREKFCLISKCNSLNLGPELLPTR